MIFEKEELDQSGNLNYNFNYNATVSTIFYLLKIQNLTPGTISLWKFL